MKITTKKEECFLDFESKSIPIFCSKFDEHYEKQFYEHDGVEYKYSLESNDDFTFLLKDVMSDDFPDDLFLNYSYDNDIERTDRITLIKKHGQFNIQMWLSFGWYNWHEDIHLSRFCPVFVKNLKSYGFESISLVLGDKRNEGIYEVTVNQRIQSNITIGQVIDNCNKNISEVINQTLEEIQQHWFSESFDFPDEYKHIFAKYLTFFGQFLEDIGIKGQVSVATLDKGVLLTFDPKGKDEAIENIKMALNTYLALPSNVDVIKPNQEPISQVKYQQLLATIDHLQGSLRLANALVDIKELENNVLKVSQMNMVSVSQSQAISSSDEKWELIEGITISKFKGKFYEIDIPKLAKRIGLNNK